MPLSYTESLLSRESGLSGFSRKVAEARARSLQLTSKGFKAPERGSLTWLALDATESRYLLASTVDSSIVLYDVLHPSIIEAASSTAARQEHAPVGTIDKNTREGHKYSVSCAAWYPVDTGLFISGSYDNSIKAWDTELLQTAASFQTPARVETLAVSATASAHSLIAAAGNDAVVRLCDISSGAFTHTLSGHREAVWALHWSLLSDWVVVSGGCDGQVRMWDIRMSGCTAMFDQHVSRSTSTSRAKRQQVPAAMGPASNITAHDGAVTAVMPTPDGLSWLTAGTDSRVRQWDSLHHRNMLINFTETYNRSNKARQVAVAQESNVLYHPSGSVIQMLQFGTGEKLGTLRGHMDAVHGCVFNPVLQEVYTGGNDRQILAWTPSQHDELIDQDTWSDDE